MCGACMCVEPDAQWLHCLKKRAPLLWVSSPTLDFIKGLLFVSVQTNINYEIIVPLITKLTVHLEKKWKQIKYNKNLVPQAVRHVIN